MTDAGNCRAKRAWLTWSGCLLWCERKKPKKIGSGEASIYREEEGKRKGNSKTEKPIFERYIEGITSFCLRFKAAVGFLPQPQPPSDQVYASRLWSYLM